MDGCKLLCALLCPHNLVARLRPVLLLTEPPANWGNESFPRNRIVGGLDLIERRIEEPTVTKSQSFLSTLLLKVVVCFESRKAELVL